MSLRLAINNKIILNFLLLFLLAIFFCSKSSADEKLEWKEIKTRYTIIRYQSYGDLKRFDKNIDYSVISSSSGLELLSSALESNDLKDKIKDKVDAIFRRVQQILDMRKKVEKVKINIYQDRKNLKKVFKEIYKKEGKLRAWYIFEYNTIYLNVKDLHEGMLAHEIAHSIIDHYFGVRPPSATAEIIARAVDSNLMK